MLAWSVLTDSAMEHYRGSFRNKAMLAPLAMSSGSIALDRGGEGGIARAAIRIGSIATGFAGLGFHLYNVRKRPGGATFTNFFYGAPLGAPGALILAGSVGAVADGLRRDEQRIGPIKLADGRVIGALAAFGLLGTVAEAGFLHFRGAYHDPFMWIPVTLPPTAAALLARDVVRGQPTSWAKGLLIGTIVVGVAGSAFHAYGVARNMGGWRNWRQNLLAGPPIPAPPAFAGLALAGLGGLLLMGSRRRD